MAVTKTLLCSFVVLAITHLAVAQDDSNQKSGGFQFPSFGSLNSGSFGGFQLPNFPGFGSGLGSNLGSGSGQSGFLAFPFSFPSIPGLNRPASSTTPPTEASLTTSTVAGNRKRRQTSEDEGSQGPQNRLFFSRFPTITSCNSTTEAGASCRSCTQALTCRSNNIGILTRCRGLFRHCNNGRCSLTQSAACSGTTASTTASTTVSSTASTASGTTASSTSGSTASSTASSTAESTTASTAGSTAESTTVV